MKKELPIVKAKRIAKTAKLQKRLVEVKQYRNYKRTIVETPTGSYITLKISKEKATIEPYRGILPYNK